METARAACAAAEADTRLRAGAARVCARHHADHVPSDPRGAPLRIAQREASGAGGIPEPAQLGSGGGYSQGDAQRRQHGEATQARRGEHAALRPDDQDSLKHMELRRLGRVLSTASDGDGGCSGPIEEVKLRMSLSLPKQQWQAASSLGGTLGTVLGPRRAGPCRNSVFHARSSLISRRLRYGVRDGWACWCLCLY